VYEINNEIFSHSRHCIWEVVLD